LWESIQTVSEVSSFLHLVWDFRLGFNITTTFPIRYFLSHETLRNLRSLVLCLVCFRSQDSSSESGP
jgi:hypothetical protein